MSQPNPSTTPADAAQSPSATQAPPLAATQNPPQSGGLDDAAIQSRIDAAIKADREARDREAEAKKAEADGDLKKQIELARSEREKVAGEVAELKLTNRRLSAERIIRSVARETKGATDAHADLVSELVLAGLSADAKDADVLKAATERLKSLVEKLPAPETRAVTGTPGGSDKLPATPAGEPPKTSRNGRVSPMFEATRSYF